jgi:hypothetical protein
MFVVSRYLRARLYDPKAALGQFKDTEIWRQEHDVDKLYDNFDVQEFDNSRRVVCSHFALNF